MYFAKDSRNLEASLPPQDGQCSQECLRRDVGRISVRGHELAWQTRVVAQHMWQKISFARPCAIPNFARTAWAKA